MATASPSHGSSSVPIVVISVIGITTTVTLLVVYYYLVMRCFFRSRQRGAVPPQSTNSPFFLHNGQDNFHPRGGLDDSTIRSLPIVSFHSLSPSLLPRECAVCLSSFHDEEKLRLLPGCSHHFHIDCVDTWLHNTPTCPLCRTRVSPFDLPASTQLSNIRPPTEEEDEEGGPPTLPGRRKLSLGDEFLVDRSIKERAIALWSPLQPIRRSFSMDSSSERQLRLQVREAFLLRREQQEGSERNRRSLFSFAHGWTSRSSAVLPVRLDDV